MMMRLLAIHSTFCSTASSTYDKHVPQKDCVLSIFELMTVINKLVTKGV